MKKLFFACLFVPGLLFAESGTQITIYNDDFAAVKESRTLEVSEGVSEIRITDVSRQLEADSVILRELAEPEQQFGLRVLEQSFVNDPLTEGLLLYQMEGQEVRFEQSRPDGTVLETTGKVIRSGYIPGGGREEPIIQTQEPKGFSLPGNEKAAYRFSLPGRPVFDSLDPNAFLKPSLVWQLAAKRAGSCPVEIAYITGGLSWEATYSLIAPAEGEDVYDFRGWITFRNTTGKTFPDAEIKLIAGDVQKIQTRQRFEGRMMKADILYDMPSESVEERSFDEFHLYTLPRSTTLRDKETKQVEFFTASGVKGTRTYVYEARPGAAFRSGYYTDRGFTATQEKKVGIKIEIPNTTNNMLGIPLPKGRMRMYRTDEVDGRPEFTGENMVDHLPKNETIKLEMGKAFDLVAERTQADFAVDTTAKWMTESFEIKLRNRKETPVEIKVVEALNRAMNWKITGANFEYTKKDAFNVEFVLPVPADGETVLEYSVRYTW